MRSVQNLDVVEIYFAFAECEEAEPIGCDRDVFAHECLHIVHAEFKLTTHIDYLNVEGGVLFSLSEV